MLAGAGWLLEREPELARIRAVLDRAQEGAGACVVVEGPAGIGKTRLARAARETAGQRGFRLLNARAVEIEREYSFGVVRQLLEPTLRAAPERERARLLEGAAALAVPAILPEASLEWRSTDPAFGVLHGLYWLCANLAETSPLLLVADDVHWADEPSLRFLRFLAHRLEALPVVLIVTRRRGESAASELLADPSSLLVALEPLSPEAVDALLHAAAAGRVDPSFSGACHAVTGGNPFLLDQLVRALLERSVPFTSESLETVEAIAPETVSAAVLARIARIGPRAVSLAGALAVLGDDAQLSLAAELAGLDEASAADAAAELVSGGVLEDARPLRFEHPIVRDAVRGSLSAGDSARLHRQAAELLAARGASNAEVALHLIPADPGAGSRWIVDMLVAAADDAVAQGAPAIAASLLERALAEPPAARERSRLLLELGRVESSLGRSSAIDRLEAAHRLAATPLERGACALQLGWARMVAQADGAQALPLIDAAIAEVESLDRDLTLELEGVRMALLSLQGLLSLEATERLERFAELEGKTRAECALLGHLAHLRMDVGRPAVDAAELARRVAANKGVVVEVGFDASWLLSCLLVLNHAERFDEALSVLELVLDESRRRGSLSAFAIASTLRARVLLSTGRVDDAEADASAGLDASSARSWFWLPAVATMIDLLIEAGRLDDAERLLVRHDALGELPALRPATVLVQARAGLRAAQGRLDAARADFDAVRRRLEAVTSRSIVGLDARLSRALVLHELGDTGEARAEARDALDIARSWDADGWTGNALRVHALLSPVESQIEALQEAVVHLERSPRRLDHARALVDLGAALRRSGARSASRLPLREALELAHRCGGVAVRERARQELAASGVRVQRERQTGVDSLTPSERRIVERAAAGASNREIAQALFVTVKTVEMHLGHAYGKLGITSRNQLAAQIAVGEPR
jgi:DNA-binding CsgD family transcriptional regulator